MVRSRLLRSDHRRAGPGSITWTLNREVIVVAGWGRAVLMQLAHPAVAAGIHGHSTFRGSLRSSFRRLDSTIESMLALTFGNTEQMVIAAAAINVMHDRVRGCSHSGAGQQYSANDPARRRWVHPTRFGPIPLTHARDLGPLGGCERDQYCEKAATMGPRLGIPVAGCPPRV